jgi:hypothetical protein
LRPDGPFLTFPALYEKQEITMATQAGAWKHTSRSLSRKNSPAQVVSGAPHGFGVWIGGEFYCVDIGAPGAVIVKLTGELEAAPMELVEQCQASQSPQQA